MFQTHNAVQFDRKIIVKLWSAGTTNGIQINQLKTNLSTSELESQRRGPTPKDLRIIFSITRDATINPDSGSVQIYNLAEVERNKITEICQSKPFIQIDAGYLLADNVDLIMLAEPKYPEHRLVGNDWVTTIDFKDGARQLTKQLSLSYKEKVSKNTILEEVFKNFSEGVEDSPFDNQQAASIQDYSNYLSILQNYEASKNEQAFIDAPEYTFNGSNWKFLQDYYTFSGGATLKSVSLAPFFTVQDSILKVIDFEFDAKKNPFAYVVINSGRNLLEPLEILKNKNVRAVVLLEASIRPGTRAKVDDVIYGVVSTTLSADNFSSIFHTEFIGKEL